MSDNSCKGPKFDALKRKWYEKLKRSGFDDIEQDENYLNTGASNPFSRKAKGETYKDKEVFYKSREEYYRLAGQFFWEYPWSSRKEQLIWELHKEGTSIRDIVLELKRKRFKAHRRAVHETIQRLKQEMIKRYSNG